MSKEKVNEDRAKYLSDNRAKFAELKNINITSLEDANNFIDIVVTRMPEVVALVNKSNSYINSLEQRIKASSRYSNEETLAAETKQEEVKEEKTEEPKADPKKEKEEGAVAKFINSVSGDKKTEKKKKNSKVVELDS